MKKLLSIPFILLMVLGSFSASAQEKPISISRSEPVQFVPSLASRTNLPAPVQKGEVNPKRRSGQNIVIPGKGFPKGNDPLINLQRRSQQHQSRSPLLTFEAAYNGATPSDPTGAVGPNHYVMAYNTAFKIFNKQGGVLINDTNLSALFPGSYSDGDPIVLYDQFADRFLITEFDVTSTPNKFLVAISQTPDPVNGGWYIYKFDVSGGMPDYPKFSVWSDGYYITTNKNSSTASSSKVVYAIERDKMLTGDQTAQMIGFSLPGISTNGFYSPSGFNAIGTQLPPRGNAPIIYMQDDSWSGISTDHLKIWNINVDWTTPTNSTISSPQQLNTTAFNAVFNNGSFSNLQQPNGIKIDALQATVMFMTNYRRFSNYNSVVLNFVVNTNNAGKAGIRWFELRQTSDGAPWTIYQEGTYIDASNHNTFGGSISIDDRGNIGLGYAIVDTNQPVELRYTGRYKNDALGQMTVTSEAFVPGSGSSNASRYGDYAQMTVDPSDNKTFWFIGEYFKTNHRRDQVGVFKLASSYTNDLGVIRIDQPVTGTLGNNESVQVTIENFGSQTQSNFPVSYQVNGGNVVTENFTGSIVAGATAQFTFNTTADLSNVGLAYTVVAATNLSGDEDNSNDGTSVVVNSIAANDVGIVNVVSPVSGSSLTNSESIQVTLENFGGVAQSNIPVSYQLDGGSVVNETVTATLNAGAQATYTFSQTGDFTNLGTHHLIASTHLAGDADTSNDAISVDIDKQICQPTSDCSQGDEIKRFRFGTIDNTSTCNGTGYSDFTAISTYLVRNNSYDLSVDVGYSNEHINAWIDYNDDFVFSDNEKIVNNQIIEPGQNVSGNFSATYSINISSTANLGEHLLRIRTKWNSEPNACDDISYGETEDYKLNLVSSSGINGFDASEISVKTLSNNHFEISLSSTNMEEDLNLTVYTIGGKQIVYHDLKNINSKYSYDLDMTYVAKGVYLLRIGNNKGGKIKKIIVK